VDAWKNSPVHPTTGTTGSGTRTVGVESNPPPPPPPKTDPTQRDDHAPHDP
jgi:hypothetical protein